jgi:tetratricopeptide (TPR) repeat protein
VPSRWRGPQLYLAGLALLSLAACFLPLADHLGYELSELVALAAGMFGAAPGVAAARSEGSPPRAVKRALWFALGSMAIPVAIILLNGVRRPACDPLGGIVLYAAIAVPCALLAAMLGVVCGLFFPRRAGVAVAIVFLVTLAISLWPVIRGPQVFVFDHLAGFYPGPLYDEAIRVSPALWIFRGGTLLYAGALAGVALLPKRRGVLLLVVCGVAALALSLQAERLHWKASASQLDAELGGRMETEHLVLHFPREKLEAEQKLLARAAEAEVRAVRAFLGGGGEGGKIHVYLYRSADEKRRLIGAAETSFTKPWLRQIHTNDAPAPHPILRHELVHALGADLAHGLWGVPGGLIPQMALIEGIAVAGDWPPGEFTVHEETRALRDLRLMPDVARLFKTGFFYAESGPRAYVTAGSFVRWLWETRGPAFVHQLYASSKSLTDLPALAAEHIKFLESLHEPERAVVLASYRYSAPAIVRKKCAHEVAGLQHEAQAAAQRGDRVAAASLWARCADLEPDDPALLLQLARAQLAAGQIVSAEKSEKKALAHPKLSPPLRAQILVSAGDTAWKAGDTTLAQQRFQEAAKLAQPEAAERALAARLRAVLDPATWPALRPLLADGNTAVEIVLELRDLDLARPRDGLAAYLIAKQMQNRGAWEECLRYATSSLSRELPDSRFVHEALRMRGLSAWHLGNDIAAREAFVALGLDAPPGRALESQRWFELLH